MNCAYIPFREDNVAEIYQGVSALLPAEFAKYKLQIRTNKRSIEELVPQALRSKKTKRRRHSAPSLPSLWLPKFPPPTPPPTACITGISPYGKATAGTTNQTRPLGMAACAYLPDSGRPLHPELRIALPRTDVGNAGANVLLPRERDCQTAEVIVDNDGCLTGRSVYTEIPVTSSGVREKDKASPTCAPIHRL